jgi:osmotically inducible protein OsmC
MGSSREGAGRVAFGGLEGAYSYGSRWEGEQGCNPEELLGAAHAACFSMSFAARLTRAGLPPERIETEAEVLLLPGPDFRIAQIVLRVQASVPGASSDQFDELAKDAKANCPVSKALAGVDEIILEARLV